jgi:hypothetical protein
MDTKNTNQYIQEVAYYLQNAEGCLNNALNSEEKPVNKQQIQNIFKGVEGALQNVTTTLSNYKD